MFFQVDLHSAKPIYLQLIDQMKQALASGRIQADEKLPSIRDVAVELRVNRNTVARVYAELESEGLIYTRAGQGCFASDRGADHLNERTMRGELLRHINEVLAQARIYRFPREKIEKIINERLDFYYADGDAEPPTKSASKGKSGQ